MDEIDIYGDTYDVKEDETVSWMTRRLGGPVACDAAEVARRCRPLREAGRGRWLSRL
jgi:hypothetical protein